MSSKNRFQKRARRIQKDTGWSYSECLRLSRSEISEEALGVLMKMRGVTKTEVVIIDDPMKLRSERQ